MQRRREVVEAGAHPGRVGGGEEAVDGEDPGAHVHLEVPAPEVGRDLDGEQQQREGEEEADAAVGARPERRALARGGVGVGVGVGPARRHPAARGGGHGERGGGRPREAARGAVRPEEQHPRDLARVLAPPPGLAAPGRRRRRRVHLRRRGGDLGDAPVGVLHPDHHGRAAANDAVGPRVPPPPRRRHWHARTHALTPSPPPPLCRTNGEPSAAIR
uniref:Uncharacterized protein n=1 Tax=Zea mays TaxID=4577 RepID=A0A804Q299_MAIZE